MINNKQLIVQSIEILYEFYGKNISELAINLWVKSLQEFTAEEIKKGCSEFMKYRESTDRLEPSTIIRFIKGNTEVKRIEALQAWETLTKYLSCSHGSIEKEFKNHPSLKFAVQNMGISFKDLSLMEINSFTWENVKKEFINSYIQPERNQKFKKIPNHNITLGQIKANEITNLVKEKPKKGKQANPFTEIKNMANKIKDGHVDKN